MSELRYTVAMPPGVTGGKWTLTPQAQHPVGDVVVALPHSGEITAAGVLVSGGAVPDLPASVPGEDVASPEYLLELSYAKGGRQVPGVPVRLRMVETEPGIVDVATLLKSGRAVAVTPEDLADLTAAKQEARAAAQSVTDATLDLSGERQRVEEVRDAATEALERAAVDVTYTTDAERNAAAPANGTRSYTLASRLNHERRNGAWVQVGEGAASAPVVNMIRRNIEATQEALRAGTHDPGTASRIYTEAGSMSVVSASQAAKAPPATVYTLAGDKYAVHDRVPVEASYYGLVPWATEAQMAAAWHDVIEHAEERMATNIPDLRYAGLALELDPLDYRVGDAPILKGNLSVSGRLGTSRAARLIYMGTDYALRINNDILGPYTAAGVEELVTDIGFSNLTLSAPNAKGRLHLIGARTHGHILYRNVEFYDIGGMERTERHAALELAEAAYPVTLLNCNGRKYNMLARQREYCDRFTIQGGMYGAATHAHVMLYGPTATLRDVSFEASLDPVASLQLFVGHAGGTVLDNVRDGPEGNVYHEGAAVAPYSLLVDSPDPDRNVYEGLTLSNMKFFSRATTGWVSEADGTQRYYSRKTAPICLNVGVIGGSVSNAQATNYSSGLLVVSEQPERVRAHTPDHGLRVDRLEDVSPQIRGVTWERTVSSRRRIRATLGSGWFSVGGRFGMLDGGASTLPILQPTAAAPSYPFVLRQLGAYVADAGGVGGAAAWVDIPGSVVQMPINGASAPVGSPVYLSDEGTPTLTPAYLTRRVGWTLEGRYNCRVRLDFGPLVAPAMPTTGEFRVGDVVDHLYPPVTGDAGSRYVLLGWRRLTTGSGHVLGTDWVERREPTGT